jgi:hypothetical protein
MDAERAESECGNGNSHEDRSRKHGMSLPGDY